MSFPIYFNHNKKIKGSGKWTRYYLFYLVC
jgi:hypothetical protein